MSAGCRPTPCALVTASLAPCASDPLTNDHTKKNVRPSGTYLLIRSYRTGAHNAKDRFVSIVGHITPLYADPSLDPLASSLMSTAPFGASMKDHRHAVMRITGAEQLHTLKRGNATDV